MERVKFSRVEVYHGDSPKKFPVYEIYLDGVIVTKVSSKTEAEEMVSRWQEVYKQRLLLDKEYFGIKTTFKDNYCSTAFIKQII